jgi:hypothetical protein
MSYDQPQLKTLTLEELTLDTINPRFVDEQDGQEQTIKHLFDTAKIVELATDILKQGYFENEVPIVLAQNQKYIVLEGNRRVCCLKALNNPHLTPTKYTNKISQLLTRYELEAQNLPKSIRVLVVNTREEAAPHIARLHTKTTKEKWTLDQQATFYYNQYLQGTKISTILASDENRVVRLMKMAAMRRLITSIPYNNDELKHYAGSSDLKMSMLEYAYNKAEIQEAFGIEFTEFGLVREQGSAEVYPKPEEVATRLSTNHINAIEYIIKEFKAKRLNTRSPRLKTRDPQYQALITTLKHLQDHTPNETYTHDTNEDPNETFDYDTHSNPAETQPDISNPEHNARKTIENTEPPSRRPRKPSSSNQLPFQGVNYKKLPVNLRTRYWELESLNIDRQPITAACLMRSVLECQIKLSSRNYITQQISEIKSFLQTIRANKITIIQAWRSNYEADHGNGPSEQEEHRFLLSEDKDYSKHSKQLEKLEALKKSGQLDGYFRICCQERFGSNRTLRSIMTKIASSDASIPGSIIWFNMALHNYEFSTTKDEVHSAWQLISPIIRHLIDEATS